MEELKGWLKNKDPLEWTIAVFEGGMQSRIAPVYI